MCARACERRPCFFICAFHDSHTKKFTYAHIWVYAFSGPQGRRELLHAIPFHSKDDGKFSLGKIVVQCS